MAKYKATKRGYDGEKIREIGEVFEFAGKPGSWMKAMDVAAKEEGKSEAPKKTGKSKPPVKDDEEAI